MCCFYRDDLGEILKLVGCTVEQDVFFFGNPYRPEQDSFLNGRYGCL